MLYSNDERREQQIIEFREENDFPEPDNIEIVLTRIPCPLTEPQMEELKGTVDVNRSSDCNGVDIYEEVLNFIQQKHSTT